MSLVVEFFISFCICLISFYIFLLIFLILQQHNQSGIYPSTLTNVRFVEENWHFNQCGTVLWKKIEFYKGKSGCKGIVIAAWDLGQSPCGISGCKIFWLFNIFKGIKQHRMKLKTQYSWPKKLYQFITNLFFLANIPTSGRLALGRERTFKILHSHRVTF